MVDGRTRGGERDLFNGAREVFLSAAFRNASFALFIGGILAYGAAFAWYMLDRFDLVNLLRDVNLDDSFYYFQIAWHMANGQFSTFDGGITRTNGYHPLWLFLITPVYWIFDKVEALFAIKAFEVMLVSGGIALVAGAARVARLPWILLFAALPALYKTHVLFMGMEAAAGLFMLGMLFLTVCLYTRNPATWQWALAGLSFTLPWVRLEYVAISLAVTGALCFIEWPGRRPSALAGWQEPARGFPTHSPSPGKSGRSVLELYAAAPFLGALAGVLVYFAYNGIVFGGIVPVSGATKRFWSQSTWEREGEYSLAESSHYFLQRNVFDDELLIALEACIYVLLVYWFARRRPLREDWLLLAFLLCVFGLAAHHLAKFAENVLFVHPKNGNYDQWYYVPAYLMEALIVPARCYVAIWFIRRFIGPRLHRASDVPSLGVVLLAATFLFAKADFTAPFRFVDENRENVSREKWARKGSSYMGTVVMNRLLPEGSVVGSGSAGRMGYFSRFPVMNLDGLANSWDYLRAQKEGNRALRTFRQRHGITHLALIRDWSQPWHRVPDSTRFTLFEGVPFNWKGGWRQFRLFPTEWNKAASSRGGVDPSVWFWDRMEPHLQHSPGGVGLLVHGRMVQAFVRDCAPDALAVLTWGDGTESVRAPWTLTTLGYCTSAIVLPHDASPPVRAAVMTAGEALAARLGDLRPAIDSDFDVYLVENRLVYVKEPCGEDDVAARFFLHVGPVDPDDLPGHRRYYGFDNLDFWFDERGHRVGEHCWAEVPLPDYGIAAIRTGQFIPGEGHVWDSGRVDVTGQVVAREAAQ